MNSAAVSVESLRSERWDGEYAVSSAVRCRQQNQRHQGSLVDVVSRDCVDADGTTPYVP